MRSRNQTKQRPLPRCNVFERRARSAASNRFKEKGHIVHAKRLYRLSNLNDWKNNIILSGKFCKQIKTTLLWIDDRGLEINPIQHIGHEKM